MAIMMMMMMMMIPWSIPGHVSSRQGRRFLLSIARPQRTQAPDDDDDNDYNNDDDDNDDDDDDDNDDENDDDDSTSFHGLSLPLVFWTSTI